jgi:hypothetical protein
MINDDYCINENMIIDVSARNVRKDKYDRNSEIIRRDIVFRLLTNDSDEVSDEEKEIVCLDDNNSTVAGYIKRARERFAKSKAGEKK